MVHRVLIALAAITLSGASAHAACAPKQGRPCPAQTINLGGVPEISQQIAGQEPQAVEKKPAAPDVVTAPYSGPTVGVSDRVRRAPTVGYRWSLE